MCPIETTHLSVVTELIFNKKIMNMKCVPCSVFSANMKNIYCRVLGANLKNIYCRILTMNLKSILRKVLGLKFIRIAPRWSSGTDKYKSSSSHKQEIYRHYANLLFILHLSCIQLHLQTYHTIQQ
jgi:hypothetical protein